MELYPVYGTAAVIVAVFLAYLLSGRFDPFAPIWMFLVGYVQIYVFQAYNFHDWAVRVRGPDLVMTANVRALWALVWFMVVYHIGIAKPIAARFPKPPSNWSLGTVSILGPLFFLWGLTCTGLVLRGGGGGGEGSPEGALLGSFPFTMLVGAILVLVTGRAEGKSRPAYTVAGVFGAAAYVLIWMFNGKRSHSLMGVLAIVCAFYLARMRRPSWPVLIATAFVGAMAVSIAIGWRYARTRDPSAQFITFVSEFDFGTVLENMNLDTGDEESTKIVSYETQEYGGYLVMLAAVPSMAEYDYGASYLRTFSTFIPRFIWPTKPYYGREQWVNAWIAGSEFKRDSTFTGPAIGLLGATQLNGGALGTFIVVGCVALVLRICYEFFLMYSHCAWAQAWWALFFFNAWFMVVTDDPMIWFYYNWGFTCFPMLVLFWLINRMLPKPVQDNPAESEYSLLNGTHAASA